MSRPSGLGALGAGFSAPLAVWIAAMSLAGEPWGTGAAAKLCLKATRTYYLIGEPVVLIVTLRNLGNEPLMFKEPWIGDGTYREIMVLISGDGQFRAHVTALREGLFGTPRIKLEPGEAWTRKLRLLYDANRPGHLAFPEADRDYQVMVVHKFPWNGQREMEASNIIRLRIVRAGLHDRDVWKRVSALHPLQLEGGLRLTDLKTARELMDILRRFPNTGYHVPIKFALCGHYRYLMNGGFSESKSSEAELLAHLRAIREVLGIPEGKRAVYATEEGMVYLFDGTPASYGAQQSRLPQDARLDKAVWLPSVAFEPLEERLENMGRQFGIPLRVAGELRGSYQLFAHEEGVSATVTLRDFMAHVAVPGTKWVKEGDGYMLVPAPPEESKKE